MATVSKPTFTYTIKIDEVREGSEEGGYPLLECRMNANSDETATEVMSDLLLSVSKRNNIDTVRLNSNIYKTQWLNGI